MGRPLAKRFFGNTNPGGVGGEGVASITIVDNTTTDPDGTYPLVIGAPDLLGGVQAVASATVDTGIVTAVTVTVAGSGYTAPPAVSGVTEASFTAVLTTGRPNSFIISAFIPAADGGSSAVAGDIKKQDGARSYKVTTAQGTGICKLVAAAPAAGEMTIVATDSTGKTYYVTKLTSHKAILTQFGAAGHEFATGANVKWTLGAAVLNESVTIASN